jgi:prepilin-type N-terminal cleavage/methylation domain-containing protein
MPAGRAQSAEAAFSLLELVVALALSSVATTAAVLAWPRIESALALDAGLQQVASDLRGAQTLAIASAGRVRLVFRAGAGVYRRERMDDAGTYQADEHRELPRGITVAEVNSGGDLAFSPRGQGENGTLVLTDRRGIRRTLRLNQRGRITILGAGL